jgi:hypothetical protein
MASAAGAFFGNPSGGQSRTDRRPEQLILLHAFARCFVQLLIDVIQDFVVALRSAAASGFISGLRICQRISCSIAMLQLLHHTPCNVIPARF